MVSLTSNPALTGDAEDTGQVTGEQRTPRVKYPQSCARPGHTVVREAAEQVPVGRDGDLGA